MVGVRPCLLKGCHGNCLIRLVQDEPGAVQFSICQPLHSLWSLPAGATVSASRIASPGTMVNTSGPLGNAATVMFVVHAMGTTARLPAHFNLPRSCSFPLLLPFPKGEEVSEENMSHSLLLRVYISLFLLILTRSLVVFIRRRWLFYVRGLPQWFCSCLGSYFPH